MRIMGVTVKEPVIHPRLYMSLVQPRWRLGSPTASLSPPSTGFAPLGLWLLGISRTASAQERFRLVWQLAWKACPSSQFLSFAPRRVAILHRFLSFPICLRSPRPTPVVEDIVSVNPQARDCIQVRSLRVASRSRSVVLDNDWRLRSPWGGPRKWSLKPTTSLGRSKTSTRAFLIRAQQRSLKLPIAFPLYARGD